MYNMPNTTMYNETSSTTLPTGAIIWILIALIVAIIGGICLYFTVFSDKNKGKYTGFMGWLYDFVKFKKMYITTILKVVYLISAIFITLASFACIKSPLAFFCILIIGNLVLRISYEFSLVLLSIHENVVEINEKNKM